MLEKNGTPECACFNLRRAARLIAQAYDRYLQPAGINNTRFTLLAALKVREPISISELAGELGMDRTTLTRNLKIAEREDHVQILAGADARTREVRLTPAGRARLKVALPHWQKAQARVVKLAGTRNWPRMLAEIQAATEVARNL